MLILTLAVALSAPPSPPAAGEPAPAADLASGAAVGVPGVDAYERTSIAGFDVLVHRDLLAEDSVLGRRAIAALTWDLELVATRLPAPALDLLRRTTPVWLTPDLPSCEAWHARGLCHHPSRDWLVRNGYGPDRAEAVEVCDVNEYLLWRAEQPLCVLHEMAHALQHQLGDPSEIRLAFEHARDTGRYEEVRSALAPEGRLRRAYALNNHYEYFAELSEAYFGRNDFAPFTRDELASFDPDGLSMLETVWAMPAALHAASQGAAP